MLKAAYTERSSSYPLLARMVDKVKIRSAVLVSQFAPCNDRGAQLKQQELMRNASSDLLEPQVLAFQARHATILHSRRMRRVHLEDEEDQQRMMADILGALARDSNGDYRSSGDGSPRELAEGDWSPLGAHVDEAGAGHEMHSGLLFRGVGQLGLECLVSQSMTFPSGSIDRSSITSLFSQANTWIRNDGPTPSLGNSP